MTKKHGKHKKIVRDDLLARDPYDVRHSSSFTGSESSPYWGHVSKTRDHDGDRLIEPPRANPDNFDESATPWEPRYSTAQKDKLAAIQDSFSVLTDQERRIIVLIYTESLTQEEIAKRLKVSQQRISSALESARKKIQRVYSSKSALGDC